MHNPSVSIQGRRVRRRLALTSPPVRDCFAVPAEFGEGESPFSVTGNIQRVWCWGLITLDDQPVTVFDSRLQPLGEAFQESRSACSLIRRGTVFETVISQGYRAFWRNVAYDLPHGAQTFLEPRQD